MKCLFSFNIIELKKEHERQNVIIYFDDSLVTETDEDEYVDIGYI